MHTKMIMAIIRKDLRAILNDQSALLGLFMPVFLAFGLNFLISGNDLTADDTATPIKLAIVNGETETIQNYFNEVELVETTFVEENLAHDEAQLFDAVIIIPASITTDPQTDMLATIEIEINGEQGIMVQQQIRQLLLELKEILDPSQISLAFTTYNVPQDSTRLLLESSSRLMDVLALLLAPCLIGTLIVPLFVVVEKEQGTDRFLLTSSASIGDYLMAKAAAGFLVCTTITVLVVVISGVNLLEIGLPLALLTTLGVVACGLLVGLCLKTFMQVNTWAGIFTLLLFLPIIEAIFPSRWLNMFSRLIPTYYTVSIATNLDASNLADWVLMVAIIGLIFAAGYFRLRQYALNMD